MQKREFSHTTSCDWWLRPIALYTSSRMAYLSPHNKHWIGTVEHSHGFGMWACSANLCKFHLWFRRLFKRSSPMSMMLISIGRRQWWFSGRSCQTRFCLRPTFVGLGYGEGHRGSSTNSTNHLYLYNIDPRGHNMHRKPWQLEIVDILRRAFPAINFKSSQHWNHLDEVDLEERHWRHSSFNSHNPCWAASPEAPGFRFAWFAFGI